MVITGKAGRLWELRRAALYVRARLSKKSFVGFHMARDEGLFILDCHQFYRPKTGWCAWTNQSSSQGPLGIKLSLTSTKRIENVSCGSNSNMESIAKAMKDALEATGYSELRDYQRKTIEAYLSGKDVFASAPAGAGKSLTFELA